MNDNIDADIMKRLKSSNFYTGRHPFVDELNISMENASNEWSSMKLPFDERLVGDIGRGGIHGSIVATLIDTTCGLALMATMKEIVPIATLTLHVDVLKAAEPNRDVFARARCRRITESVAFLEADAFHDITSPPIASASASFVIMKNIKMGAKKAPGGKK